MIIGYARLVRDDTQAEHQLDSLRHAGCRHIFTDDGTRGWKHTPGFDAALGYMEAGDILVVDSLHSLGRSLSHLVATVNRLGNEGLELRSLQESIDTTSGVYDSSMPGVFTILAEFERGSTQSINPQGSGTARPRGRKGGRPKGLSDEARRKALLAEGLYLAGDLTVMEICTELSISKPTLYNYLRHRGVAIGTQRFSGKEGS